MAVTSYDDWFLAQNQLLAICLFDCDKIPTVLSELSAEDFTGDYRLVYEAMRKLFRSSANNSEIDITAIYDTMGHSEENKSLLMRMMENSPVVSMFDRYLEMARDGSKLSRLRDAGLKINEASTLDSALIQAEEINKILADRQNLKSYGPAELIAKFRERHKENIERLPWPMDMAMDIPTRPGNMIAICAEPSGGKTAFGLQMMWEISKKKRVLFISLETDEDTLFDCWNAFICGIGMDSLMGGKLTKREWALFDEAEESIKGHDFKIIPAAGLTVSGIKALALTYRAEVVIVDYLQLIQTSGPSSSRYETVTDVSMQLHIMAQTTKITVIPLCQVTNRDPAAAGKPLTMRSARESSQIEQDMDVMVMIDLFIEKEIIKAGVRCNRIIRVVKNKRGQKFKFPARFDGLHQTFTRVKMLSSYQQAQDQRQADKEPKPEVPAPGEEFEQLPMETPVPFQES